MRHLLQQKFQTWTCRYLCLSGQSRKLRVLQLGLALFTLFLNKIELCHGFRTSSLLFLCVSHSFVPTPRRLDTLGVRCNKHGLEDKQMQEVTWNTKLQYVSKYLEKEMATCSSRSSGNIPCSSWKARQNPFQCGTTAWQVHALECLLR